MRTNVNNLKNIGIKIFTFVNVIGLGVMFYIQNELSISTVIEVISFSIVTTSLLLLIVEKYLWKKLLIFFSKYPLIWNLIEGYEVPILKENYNGVINYEWQGRRGEKQVNIGIKQTYTSINITLITDEIRSDSISAEIVNQDGVFILYYIYKTNPKAEFYKNNPSQLGGCKIILESITKANCNSKLNGIYWTTSKTIGDINLN